MNDWVDLYANPHRGLRNFIAQVSLLAGATDWTDSDAVARLSEKYEQLRHLLLKHHEKEETFIHPLLARIMPGGQRSYEADHKAQDAFLADLDSHFEGLTGGTVPPETKQVVGLEFYRGLNAFYAMYLPHLHREEEEAERALNDLCPVDELRATLGAATGSFSLDEQMILIEYVFPAITLAECVQLIRPAKASMPPEVFNRLAEHAHQVLGDDDWARIEEMMGQ